MECPVLWNIFNKILIFSASNNRDARSSDHADKLGVSYTDMDSAIGAEQTGGSSTSATGAGVREQQTPNHIVYRKVYNS